jgi:hypothetical protein
MVPAFSIPGSLNLKKILKDNSGKKGKKFEIKNTGYSFLTVYWWYYRTVLKELN